jgi:hypothetical protein
MLLLWKAEGAMLRVQDELELCVFIKGEGMNLNWEITINQ